jgi:hypothetical protein
LVQGLSSPHFLLHILVLFVLSPLYHVHTLFPEKQSLDACFEIVKLCVPPFLLHGQGGG